MRRPAAQAETIAAPRVLTPNGLLATSNPLLDRLFRASPAGDIPTGVGEGTVLLWTGTRVSPVLARLTRLLAWQGKVVNPSGKKLVNRLTPVGLRAVRARVSVQPSWVDGRDCVLIDYSRTSHVARNVRDEIRRVAPGLYLGVVWLGHRRVAWFALRFPHGR